MQNRRTVIIIIGLIVLAAVVGWLGWFSSPADVAPGTPQAEPAKRYINEKLGISFVYPSRYVLAERDLSTPERGRYAVVLLEDTAENRELLTGSSSVAREWPPTINFDFFQNLEKLPPEVWLRSVNDSNYKLSPDGVVATTAVAGVSAYRYRWSGLYEGESTVWAAGENVVMSSVTWLTPTDRIITDLVAVLGTWRQ